MLNGARAKMKETQNEWYYRIDYICTCIKILKV